jgi:uncharacterized protein (TIGR02145 family)
VLVEVSLEEDEPPPPHPTKNATVKDANEQKATAKSSNSNVYVFATTPVYPITATGGYIDVDANGTITTTDVAFTGVLKSYSTVITPITTYVATGITQEDRATKLTELKGKIAGTVSDDDLLKKVPSETSIDIVVLTNAIYDSYSVLFDTDTTNDDVSSLSTIFTDKIALYKNVVTQSGSGKTIKELATLVEEELIINKGIPNLTDSEVAKINGTTTPTIIPVTPVVPIEPTTFQSGQTFNGFVYNIITSPITGKRWLDRNLGASQACTSSTDSTCYGDYYQWGRLTDGHEKVSSALSSTLATGITSVGSNFITNSSFPYDWTTADADGSLRTAQWSKTDGTGVCPVGFRVPTIDELKSETLDYAGVNNISTGAVKVIDGTTAFQNFLKFPVAGGRHSLDGSMLVQGLSGYIWTTSVGSSSDTKYLSITLGSSSFDRANGVSVRCIEGN